MILINFPLFTYVSAATIFVFRRLYKTIKNWMEHQAAVKITAILIPDIRRRLKEVWNFISMVEFDLNSSIVYNQWFHTG